MGQPVPKSEDNRTLSAIGENAGESYKTVQRYIRLTNLIPELLELVDEGKIALTPAVELSYLTDEQQYVLLDTIEEEERTPSFSQAVRFKKLSQSNELDTEQIEAIMQDYGANLICVEYGIDSSKDSGKLMISVLSAVAEIERENILVQTMEGRK